MDKSWKVWGIIISLFIVFILLIVFGVKRVDKTPSLSEGERTDIPSNEGKSNDDLSLLISKYGKPDIDDSTQYDNPRPPIVTRWLIYKKENVRAWYVPDGVSIDDPPPYHKWKLFSFVDEKTKKPISAYEADRRLKQRLKNP
jgi:hypothetical protein